MTRALRLGVALVLLARPASAQWSVSFLLGDASTSPTRLELQSAASDTVLALDPVAFADESSRSPWYYGIRVARHIDRIPWLAIEAEFIHAKAISDPTEVVLTAGRLNGVEIDRRQPLGATLPRFELSHGLNVIVGNAVLHWPVVRRGQRSILEVVGRAGAGPAIPHVEATFMARTTDEYQLAGWALAGGAGVDLRLSNHVSAIVDLAWTRTRLHLDIETGDLEGLFTTRHALAGVTWRFAPRP